MTSTAGETEKHDNTSWLGGIQRLRHDLKIWEKHRTPQSAQANISIRHDLHLCMRATTVSPTTVISSITQRYRPPPE